MRQVRISPGSYPIKKGETWWIVHPNTSGCEFRIPMGGMTLCTLDIEVFQKNTVYPVLSADNHNGWVSVGACGTIYEMPQYLFARHFDAEAFVVGVATPEEIERAKPFDYKPTVPSRQLSMNFKD